MLAAGVERDKWRAGERRKRRLRAAGLVRLQAQVKRRRVGEIDVAERGETAHQTRGLHLCLPARRIDAVTAQVACERRADDGADAAEPEKRHVAPGADEVAVGDIDQRAGATRADVGGELAHIAQAARRRREVDGAVDRPLPASTAATPAALGAAAVSAMTMRRASAYARAMR